MTIASNAYPDPTQFDPKSDHYDPKSKQEEPRWLLVDVHFERKLKVPITLSTLREHEQDLHGLLLLAPGSRLSITPVKPAHWERSDERRVGKECVSTGSSRWSPDH